MSLYVRRAGCDDASLALVDSIVVPVMTREGQERLASAGGEEELACMMSHMWSSEARVNL